MSKKITVVILFFFVGFFKSSDTLAICANVSASFSTPTNEICGVGPTTIYFNNHSSGINANTAGYQWYLNGSLFAATTGTVLTTSSNISAAGVYNYMMVAYDTLGVCRDTSYQTVTIVIKPIANFVFLGDTFCPNINIPFTNTSANFTTTSSYNWGFGDGGSSTTRHSSHLYGSGGGGFNVTLVTSNSPSCSDTMVKSLYIRPTPQISITGDDGTGNLINCLSAVDTITREWVTFVNTSDSMINYTWNFGDGTPSVNQYYTGGSGTLGHMFVGHGTYTVICSAIAPNGCLYTDTLTVVFDKFISASLTIPITQISGCAPHTLQATNASVNATRFKWDFGDGKPPVFTNTQAAPLHIYDSTGFFVITLTAFNDCNSAASTVGPVVVSEAPIVGFKADLVGRGCAPQPIIFTDTSKLISPVTNFVWNMGNGNIYSGVPPPIQSYNKGIYTVSLMGYNGCGGDTVNFNLAIDSLPFADVVVTPDKGCSPLTVNGTATAFGYGTLSRWYVDGVLVSFGNTLPPQVFTNISSSIQTHTIRHNVANHCGDYDTTIVVYVHPEVVARLNSTPDPICFGNTLSHSSISYGDSLKYQWFFGNGSTSTISGPHSILYNKKGMDSLKLIITGHCGIDSVSKLIQVDSLPYATTSVSPLKGCSPLSVSGSSTPFGNGTSTVWLKNSVLLSNNSSFTGTVFTGSGTTITQGTIRHQTSNHCGAYDTIYNIEVHPEVVAKITPSNQQVCVGDSVTFADQSFGDSIKYLWKYRNGNTSTNKGPITVGFPDAGIDTVWLFIDGKCGKDSVFKEITVISYPVADIVSDKDSGCEDLSVNFTNSSASPLGSTYSWVFNIGTPLTSSSPTPTVIFADSGKKQVTLSVDSLGCVSKDTVEIIVFPTPDVNFTLSPLSGCSDLNVAFNNTSTLLTGDSVLWVFGNGNTDNAFSPSSQSFSNISNIKDSIYTIQLSILSINGCADTNIEQITVHPIPVSLFAKSDTSVCEKDSVYFTNTSTGATTYKWFFGDGDSSLLVSPVHSFDTAGTYLIKLISYSNNGCYDTSIQRIVVNQSPVTIFYSDSVCMNSATSFSDSSLYAPILWKWHFGDGDSSSLQHPTHIYPKDSTFTATLKATNVFGCSDVVYNKVVVNTEPISWFRYTSACPGRITNFYDSSFGNPNKWYWSFGDGGIDSVQNPQHFYDTGGVYSVMLVVSNSYGCIDTVTRSIIISTIPKTNFVADSVCVGFPTSFSNLTVLSYPVKSYLWSFGDGNSSINVSPAYTYASSGKYLVSLTVTNVNDCDSTYFDSVVVYPKPDPVFSASPLSGCSDLAVSFNNNSPFITGDTYYWVFGNGNTDSVKNPNSQTFINTLNVIDSNYYPQLFITTLNGCVDSASQTIAVRPLPKAIFVSSKDSLCEKEAMSFTNNSIGAILHKWYFGDGDSSYFSNPTHSFDTAGIYVVTLISSTVWGCVDTAYDTIVVIHNPVSRFFADSACFTFQTTFTDSSLYGPVSWVWSFGDGDSSVAQHPVHIYGKDSVYPVSLIVTNYFGCRGSSNNPVVVHPQPIAGFDLSAACAKNPTTFLDTSSGNPNKWFWSFGDGGVDSVKNPNHIYLLGGTYTVMLIVENQFGCIDTIFKNIIISTVPKTSFVGNSVCLGSPTTFINNTTVSYPVSSFFWSFGDGNSSSLANPLHQYLSSGVYTVSLTVTNINGCDSTFVDSVEVFSVPTASFSFDTVCSGGFTSFTNSSSGPILYSVWDFGDGSPLDTNNSLVVTKQYTNSGVYLAILTVVSPDSCVSSQYHSVIVNSSPFANYSPQNDTVCLGNPLLFINSSINSTLYYWDWDDGNTGTATHPTYKYRNPGVYSVQLISSNSFGCSDTVYDTVVVLQNPVASYQVGSVCFGVVSQFSNSSSGASLSWKWTFGDGASDTTSNPFHLYRFDTIYSTSLVVKTAFGCSDTANEIAVVLPAISARFAYSTACVSRPVQFSDSSKGSPVAWLWHFGDGSSSSLQNPVHSYSAVGNFTVTLIVENQEGCFDTVTKNIFVNSIPVPNFTANSACYGAITYFTNLSTNSQPITSYYWDFGDGNSSNDTNPKYTYSAPGIYQVTLTVTNNGGCDSSITFPVVVKVVPIANFTHDTVCVGLPTSFIDASSGSPVAWKWNFGDFTPVDSLSGSFVTHSYSTPGQYIATLTVKGPGNSCTSTSIKYISVLGGADARFNVSTPICDGNSVQFINSSTASQGGIVSTQWDFGDGNTSSTQNPTHLYATHGVYRATLTVTTSFGCTGSDSSIVLINAVPSSKFGYAKNICLGFPTPFTDSSLIVFGSISKWYWDFGDGNTDSTQNPSNNYAAPGNYWVTLTVESDSGCIGTSSQLVTISPKANVVFNYKPVCVGDTMWFKDNSTILPPDSIVSWLWDFGDGTTSTLQNPGHAYKANTQNYLVKLSVKSNFGCINDTSILVSHFAVPYFNYGPELFGYCENDVVQFYDSSIINIPTSILSWEWDFGNVYGSFAQSPAHTYDSAGSYQISIKMTSSDGCIFYDSLPSLLIIYPNPVADFLTVPEEVSVFRPEVYFDNLALGAVNYVWNFGDGSFGYNDFPTHMFPNVPGDYFVTQYAYSSFGCVDSITKRVFIKDEFTLYVPNAFTPDKVINNVFYAYGHEIIRFNMKVFNRWGDLFFESKDQNKGWDGTFNGKKVPAGVYVYQIDARDSRGNDHSKTGHISIIR